MAEVGRRVLVDTGPFIARYLAHDPHRERLAAYLKREEKLHRFTQWYTVEEAVSEAYTFLRRHGGLAVGQQFLEDLSTTRTPRVLSIPWNEPAALLRSPSGDRTGKGFSFTDATLVVAADRLGTKHVLTVGPADFRPFGLRPIP